MFARSIIYISIILCWVSPVWAGPTLCDQAAHNAARKYNVPVNVLLAITRTETGRAKNGKLQPWPWTVNDRGKGYWFDTESKMKQFIKTLRAQGVTSFDVGCFQLNYRWHHTGFSSLDDMAHPTHNANYAAKFLDSLYAETGDWAKAAGFYHSRTKHYAQKYQSRFQRIYASLGSNVATKPQMKPNKPRAQIFGGTTRLGSLVPINSDRATTTFIGLN